MSRVTQQINRIPDDFKGTLKVHKSLKEYFEYYDALPITNKRIEGTSYSFFCQEFDTYLELNEYNKNNTQEIIAGNGGVTNQEWYGEPLLTSVQDGLDRQSYLRMDDYKDVYEKNIRPRIQEILKTSMAKLEMPILKYNDLQLGSFDFNRASLGLVPLYKYYSFEKKDFVDGSLVLTYKDGKDFKYKLISNGSPVVIVPKILSDDKELVHKVYKEVYEGANIFDVLKKYNLRIGGTESITSTIKKTYVQKEKVKKLKNAIRIFVKVGDNNTVRFDTYKWNGYLACGLEELLTSLGYAVSISGIYGIQENIKWKNGFEFGGRFHSITLKRFDESIEKSGLLYILSDQSFFRLKIFECVIKDAEYYGDHIDGCLGFPANLNLLEQVIFKEFGSRDKMWNNKGDKGNSQFLYYVIADVHSEAQLNTMILELAQDIINKNEEARAQFG
jgi:hypothetical protein